MTYLKATAVGIVTAVIFGAAWMWAALQLPIWWQMWQQRHQGGGTAAPSDEAMVHRPGLTVHSPDSTAYVADDSPAAVFLRLRQPVDHSKRVDAGIA